jgi:hypothetical protein
MNTQPWFKVGDGSGRDGHDGFKTVGVSAPSERWVNLWSSPVRRGLPPNFESYTLCTAALTAGLHRDVDRYRSRFELQRAGRWRVFERTARTTIVTHLVCRVGLAVGRAGGAMRC